MKEELINSGCVYVPLRDFERGAVVKTNDACLRRTAAMLTDEDGLAHGLLWVLGHSHNSHDRHSESKIEWLWNYVSYPLITSL